MNVYHKYSSKRGDTHRVEKFYKSDNLLMLGEKYDSDLENKLVTGVTHTNVLCATEQVQKSYDLAL